MLPPSLSAVEADRMGWMTLWRHEKWTTRLQERSNCVKRWALVQRQSLTKSTCIILYLRRSTSHCWWLIDTAHAACQSSGSRLCFEVIFIVDGKLEISNSHPVRNLIARSSKKGTRDVDKTGNSTTRAWDNLLLSLFTQISEITLCQT